MTHLARLLPVLLLAVPAAAQTFTFERSTPATVGQSLGLRFTGAPVGASLLVMLSANTGPTPLSLLNPADTRNLSVGLDLANVWFTQPTGTGTGVVSLPLPNDASMHGATFFWQSGSVPGNPFLIGALSNPVTTQLGVAGRASTSPFAMLRARALGASFRGAGADVLYAGGGTGSLLGATGLSSSDILDARTLRWRGGPSLTTARALAATVRLNDGRVLLAGGVDSTGAVLRTCEIYDPATGLFTATGSMAVARGAHSGALLPDGRVLVVGGTTTFTDAIQALANAQATSEIFQPSTGTWSNGPNMSSRRLGPGLTTMNNGRVLMSGGFEVTVFLGLPLPVGSVATCQSYNPATNSWSSAASMRAARGAHGLNTVVLADGRVLVTGGASSGPDLTSAAAIVNAETYNPTTNAWTALPDMPSPIATHTVDVLPNGRVIVAGGASGTLAAPVAVDQVLEFRPATNTFVVLPNLATTRGAHGSFLLDDGTLALFGGNGGPQNTTLTSVELIR